MPKKTPKIAVLPPSDLTDTAPCQRAHLLLLKATTPTLKAAHRDPHFRFSLHNFSPPPNRIFRTLSPPPVPPKIGKILQKKIFFRARPLVWREDKAELAHSYVVRKMELKTVFSPLLFKS
jgi:hypothetical protein